MMLLRAVFLRSGLQKWLGSVGFWLFSIRMPCFELAMDRSVLTEAQWAKWSRIAGEAVGPRPERRG